MKGQSKVKLTNLRLMGKSKQTLALTFSSQTPANDFQSIDDSLTWILSHLNMEMKAHYTFKKLSGDPQTLQFFFEQNNRLPYTEELPGLIHSLWIRDAFRQTFQTFIAIGLFDNQAWISGFNQFMQSFNNNYYHPLLDSVFAKETAQLFMRNPRRCSNEKLADAYHLMAASMPKKTHILLLAAINKEPEKLQHLLPIIAASKDVPNVRETINSLSIEFFHSYPIENKSQQVQQAFDLLRDMWFETNAADANLSI